MSVPGFLGLQDCRDYFARWVEFLFLESGSSCNQVNHGTDGLENCRDYFVRGVGY